MNFSDNSLFVLFALETSMRKLLWLEIESDCNNMLCSHCFQENI